MPACPTTPANGWVPPVDYVYKLWLAHGVTTVREMGSMNGLGWMLRQKERSAANAIAAPHIVAHAYFPAVNDMLKVIHTPEQGRAWLRRVQARGADGIKFFGAPPAIMQAALDECRKLGLRSGCHHAQMAVTRMNALTSAKLGPDQRGTLLRPARGAVREPRGAGLSHRLRLQRRVFPLRLCRPDVRSGRRAGQCEVARGDGRVPGARLHLRADFRHLRRQSRPDARAAGRLAA